MTDWQAVWKRLSNGQHAVLCGAGPIPEPDSARVHLSWVDCEAHPEAGGTIEAARRRIDGDRNVNPWVDIATRHLRSSLRRHLLGEDADDIDSTRDEYIFRRAPPDATSPRLALLLSGVDRADRASVQRLSRLFAGEHRPTWPLLIRFDAREPTGAARALLDQLESVLPPEAIFRGAEEASPVKHGVPPAEALAQLSRESLRVMRAAATLGDRFEVETVAELLEIDELAVLDSIQEALDCGVSLEDRGLGVFRFEPGAGAALRATTLPALSSAWHRRLAELFGGLPAPAETHPDVHSEQPAVDDAPGERAGSARRVEAAGLSESAVERYLSAAMEAAHAGSYARALDAAGRALAIAQGMPEPDRCRLEARAWLVIGQGRWQVRGSEVASLDLALEALERARERLSTGRHPELHAEIASMTANVCYDIGTPEALERALVEVIRASQLWLEASRPFEAARLLNDEAAIWVKRGNAVRANQLLLRSRDMFGKLAPTHPAARLELLETEHLLARSMLHSAPLPDREGEALRVGVEHALAAEEGYRALDDQRQLGRVWETLGRLELRLGHLEGAARRLEQAHRLQREPGDAIGAARSAGGMSEVFAAAHDYPRALSSLAESVAFNSEKGSAAGLQHNLASLRQLEAQLPAALIDQARALGQRLVRALSVN